ncbi:unnamed protein product [Pedinophyceae sp. YPF-701]|nr:unnamed protein product [Pedinophyceae sp. YPF-701]
MGKKGGKGAKGGVDWDALPWKEIDVGENFLVGCKESGFMGLEAIEGLSIPELQLGGPTEEPPSTETAATGEKKKRKKRDKERAAAEPPGAGEQAPGQDGGRGDAPGETAEERIARLEAENAKLKKRLRDDKKDKQKAKKKRKTDEGAAGAPGPATATNVADDAPLADTSAWKPFLLHPLIETAIARLGFEKPTRIQEMCLPVACTQRKDVVGAAETGSGKTLAFGLPIMQQLLEEREARAAEAAEDGHPDPEIVRTSSNRLRALILAPTRELAIQVSEHLKAIGKVCRVRVEPIVGGIAPQKQERLLRGRPEVVVATPGRLWELMSQGDTHLLDTGALNFLVLDEADRMVQKGHFAELESILAKLPLPGNTADRVVDVTVDPNAEDADEEAGARRKKKEKKDPPPRVQTMVFSATLTLPESMRKRLKGGVGRGGGAGGGSPTLEKLLGKMSFRGAPAILDATADAGHKGVAAAVTQAYAECLDADRDACLYYLLSAHSGRTIVFANAVSAVRRAAAVLKHLGIPAAALHAQQQQRQRLKNLDRFRKNDDGVLVCTDVAARGIDIPDVRCVVHYQVPASPDVYVHRAGRTGRAGAEGASVAIVVPRERPRFLSLARALKGQDAPRAFPIDAAVMPQVRERVALALRIDEYERQEKKVRARDDWEGRNAAQVGVAGDEGDAEDEGRNVRRRKAAEAREVAEARVRLSQLLAEPLGATFSGRYFTGGGAAGIAAQAAAKRADGDGGVTGLVRSAVQAADELLRSRRAAQAAVDRKAGKVAGGSGNGQRGGVEKMSLEERRAAALQRAVEKKVGKTMAKKARKAAQGAGHVGRAVQVRSKRGLAVVPPALGRAGSGPDALAAMRLRAGEAS